MQISAISKDNPKGLSHLQTIPNFIDQSIPGRIGYVEKPEPAAPAGPWPPACLHGLSEPDDLCKPGPGLLSVLVINLPPTSAKGLPHRGTHLSPKTLPNQKNGDCV